MMPPQPILIAFAFAMGAVIGSFLNVCIYRLPLGRSIAWPGSACTACARPLAWYENIPIASWLALRGRCRSCGQPISSRYPVVELLTAVMCAGALWYYGPTPLFLSRFIFGCALIVLFAIDLEHQLLPNVITLPGIVIGFAFSFLTGPGWLSSLIGIAVGGGILFAIAEAYYRIRKEEGLGMGDVKMLAMIGAFLGWPATLMTLMMGSIAGSLVGVLVLALRRGDMKYALPFGTFLAMGAALSATVGPHLLDWYLRLW
ncbi:MAG: A24 family peptidase [Vicinamibacterales bacterium]